MPVTPITPAQIDEVGKGASASPSGHSRAEPSGLGPTAECPSRGAELERLSAAATPGPWAYRPEHLDDWGYIRSTVIDNPVLKGKVVATTRGDGHETFDAHREAGTDPYEPNGRFIVALVNAYRAGELVPAFAATNPSGGDLKAATQAGFYDGANGFLKSQWGGDYEKAYAAGVAATHAKNASVQVDGDKALAGEARRAETAGLGLRASDGEAGTPSPPPSPRKGQEEKPCPMTVEEARDFLLSLPRFASPEACVESLRIKAAWYLRSEAASAFREEASRIELALSTIRASEEDR